MRKTASPSFLVPGRKGKRQVGPPVERHYSIRERLSLGLYNVKLEYPPKPPEDQDEFMTRRLSDASDEDIARAREAKKKNDAAKREYDTKVVEYRDEEARMLRKFRDDLEEEHGTKGHPKADTIFNMAYDRGHSFGLASVAEEYEDLMELLQ